MKSYFEKIIYVAIGIFTSSFVVFVIPIAFGIQVIYHNVTMIDSELTKRTIDILNLIVATLGVIVIPMAIWRVGIKIEKSRELRELFDRRKACSEKLDVVIYNVESLKFQIVNAKVFKHNVVEASGDLKKYLNLTILNKWVIEEIKTIHNSEYDLDKCDTLHDCLFKAIWNNDQYFMDNPPSDSDYYDETKKCCNEYKKFLKELNDSLYPQL